MTTGTSSRQKNARQAQSCAIGDVLPAGLPPQDLHAERCVLGSCILHEPAIDEAMLLLSADHFYAEKHQFVFTTLLSMHDRGIPTDAVTVAEELQKRGQLAEVGGVPYLLELMESVPHAAHVTYYAKTVLDRARRRAAEVAALQIQRDIRDLGAETEEILAEAEGLIHTALECGAKSDSFSIEEILLDLLSPAGREKIEPIPTGWPTLDEMIGGVTPGQLVVIGARSSEGKSALATTLARRMAESGNPGLMVCYEMSRLEIAERMMLSVLNVDQWSFRRAHGNQQLLADIGRESAMLGRLPISMIDDSVCPTMSQLIAILRVVARRKKLKIVVIDYLQLIPYTGPNIPREQQIAQITRQLKQIAGQLRIVIIALSQLNRDVEKRDTRKPRLSDLRESGAIEQDANQVWLLWRPNLDGGTDGDQDDNVAELIVAKNRAGKKGTAKLAWNGPTMTFSDRGPSFGEPETDSRVDDWRD